MGKYLAISSNIRVFWVDICRYWVICSSDRTVKCWSRSDSSYTGSVNCPARWGQALLSICSYNMAQNNPVNTIRLIPRVLWTTSAAVQCCALLCTALKCATVNCTVLHSITQNCTALHTHVLRHYWKRANDGTRLIQQDFRKYQNIL